jgi:hypothetical protein
MDLDGSDRARQHHTVQATGAYYLHVRQIPFVCPFPGYGLQFGQPIDLVVHYTQTCIPRTIHDGQLPLPPCTSIHAAFERHDAWLELKRQRCSHELTRMQTAWTEAGRPGAVLYL